MAAGYDISVGASEATTQGNSISTPFTVGGGMKIPPFVFAALLAFAAFIVWKKFGK